MNRVTSQASNFSGSPSHKTEGNCSQEHLLALCTFTKIDKWNQGNSAVRHLDILCLQHTDELV
jgi:hypothetical protein